MNTLRLFAHYAFFEYILEVLRCVCSVILPSCTVYSSHFSRQAVTRQGGSAIQWRRNADSRREVNRQTGVIVEGSIQGDSMNLVCSDSPRNLNIFRRGDQPFVMSIMLYWRTNYSRRRQFWCCRPWTREHRNVRTSLLGNRHDRSALFHHAREDSTTATADRWGIPSLVHHPLYTMFFVL